MPPRSKTLPKPAPPTQAAIDADLAANLAALGLAPGTLETTEERIFAAFVERTREKKDLVTCEEVARHLGCSASTVRSTVRRFIAAGRGYRHRHRVNGKNAFVPKVVGAG